LRWAGHVIRQDEVIYPGDFSSVIQEESAPKGDPGCAGKMG